MSLTSYVSKAHHWVMKGLGRRRACSWDCSIHWSAELSESASGDFEIDSAVIIGKNTWLNSPPEAQWHGYNRAPKIRIGAGCAIGRRNVISAKNFIELSKDIVTAPNVLLMDHAHEFSDPTTPILHQGVTEGGTLRIGRGCWIGYGAAILANRGDVVIGENVVVGANSIVTQSIPPGSIVAGSPARLIRSFNYETQVWERVDNGCA